MRETAVSAISFLRLSVVVAALGLALSGCGVTEERGLKGSLDDTKIRATIDHLWFQKDHVMFGNIHLQIYEGRVLLTGLAPTPEVRRTAVDLAWRAAGVREVIDDIVVQDNTVGVDYSRDVLIANDLRTKLLFDREVNSANYSIEVVNSVVYILGVARDQVEMDRVIAHAKDEPYARRVMNYILLANDPRRSAPPRS